MSVNTRRVTAACSLLLFAVGCNTQSPVADAVDSVTAGSSSPALVAAASSIGPGALEQLMLERINRARLRPADEAARYHIAIDEGIPGQLTAEPRAAVAFNGTLAIAARKHADDMLANNYFAHDDLAGNSPFDRLHDAGYIFSAAGENLAWRGNTLTIDPVDTVERMHQDLFVDSSIPDRGHRKVMLMAPFREVGVSVRRGNYTQDNLNYDSMMAVQDYAVARASRTYFIVGVVYDDKNNNGQYDYSEGTANSNVSIGEQSTITGEGGGYTFEVAPGDYTVSFFSGVSAKLTIIDNNMKVDLVGGTLPIVNLGAGAI